LTRPRAYAFWRGTMKIGGPRFFQRSILLAAACMLALVLTACTGKGGGYLPPNGVFTGQASFGFTFSCAKGDLKIELSYNDKGSNLLGSPFGIHGIVDKVDPVKESQFCIDDNPPVPPNQITFLGRYYLTSSAPPRFPPSCAKNETSTSPLCRFEVTVQDNDKSLSPTPGDFFKITLSTGTCASPTDVSCTNLSGNLFYTRAGYLAGGNITVD
jgi:predicted small lipoprotein YifL